GYPLLRLTHSTFVVGAHGRARRAFGRGRRRHAGHRNGGSGRRGGCCRQSHAGLSAATIWTDGLCEPVFGGWHSRDRYLFRLHVRTIACHLCHCSRCSRSKEKLDRPAVSCAPHLVQRNSVATTPVSLPSEESLKGFRQTVFDIQRRSGPGGRI